MLREEGPHIAPERAAIGLQYRRGEREEVVEIIGGVVRPLHPLERAHVDDHDGGAWSDRISDLVSVETRKLLDRLRVRDLRVKVGFGLMVYKERRRRTRRKGWEIEVASFGGVFLGFSSFGADSL